MSHHFDRDWTGIRPFLNTSEDVVINYVVQFVLKPTNKDWISKKNELKKVSPLTKIAHDLDTCLQKKGRGKNTWSYSLHQCKFRHLDKGYWNIRQILRKKKKIVIKHIS